MTSAVAAVMAGRRPGHPRGEAAMTLGYKPPVAFEAQLRSVTPTLNQDEALSLNWRVSTQGRRPVSCPRHP
jgi:hypothetical protein